MKRSTVIACHSPVSLGLLNWVLLGLVCTWIDMRDNAPA
jgi:hypothetical protein